MPSGSAFNTVTASEKIHLARAGDKRATDRHQRTDERLATADELMIVPRYRPVAMSRSADAGQFAQRGCQHQSHAQRDDDDGHRLSMRLQSHRRRRRGVVAGPRKLERKRRHRHHKP